MTHDFSTMLHAQPATFFGAPLVEADPDIIERQGARVAMVGVPWDEGNGGRNGANYGPRSARDVSSWFLGYRFEEDRDLFADLRLVDCGDVPVVPSDSATTMARITDIVGRIAAGGALPIIVGGNHSVTIGSTRAIAKRQTSLGYVAIDAHIDTAPDLAGARLTSASPTARAAEMENVPRGAVAVVGVRGALNPKAQMDYAQALGVRVHSMLEIEELGANSVLQRALSEVASESCSLYASFDLDSADAGVAPGTGTPEPGGLSARQALRIARSLGAANPAAFDVVELAPAYDLSGITARLACSIIIEFLAGYAGGT